MIKLQYSLRQIPIFTRMKSLFLILLAASIFSCSQESPEEVKERMRKDSLATVRANINKSKKHLLKNYNAFWVDTFHFTYTYELQNELSKRDYAITNNYEFTDIDYEYASDTMVSLLRLRSDRISMLVISTNEERNFIVQAYNRGENIFLIISPDSLVSKNTANKYGEPLVRLDGKLAAIYANDSTIFRHPNVVDTLKQLPKTF